LLNRGNNIELLGQMPIWDRQYDAAKLTAAGGNMSDWYILYRQPGSNLIRSVAYTNTFDGSPNPHAVIFNRFVLMNNIKLSTEWSIFDWNEATGISGTPLGTVVLSNVKWVKLAKDAFKVPDGARMLDAPQAVASAD
jgi:hypothetical protein